MVGSDICLVIAGNKADLETRRVVERAAAEKFAASVNALHLQTSAKEPNSNIARLNKEPSHFLSMHRNVRVFHLRTMKASRLCSSGWRPTWWQCGAGPGSSLPSTPGQQPVVALQGFNLTADKIFGSSMTRRRKRLGGNVVEAITPDLAP